MQLPDIVVFPKSANDVVNIMKVSKEHQIPVESFGIGSSLERQVIPNRGGISIDFSQMNKIIEVREKDFLVKVRDTIPVK